MGALNFYCVIGDSDLANRPVNFYQRIMVSRFQFLPVSICVIAFLSFVFLRAEPLGASSLIESITKQTIRSNRSGGGITWFHPKACRLPGANGEPDRVLMTLQAIGGSDYFGPVHWSESLDSGTTWVGPVRIPALDRVPAPGHPGLLAGVCDVVPQYHPLTKTTLAMGHVVFYRGERFSSNDQLPRYPVYCVRRSDGSWGERRILEWDDPRGGFIYSNNCGQRYVQPNGDILLAFTFGPKSENRSVAGVLCSFDGERLAIKEVGPPLELNHGRGLLEPSITRFQDRFYLTIRAEDGKGYQSVSNDGLQWDEKEPWRWDTGEVLSLSSTQQHWLTHSDGLYLVYTRKDYRNSEVIRWRSPLWVARVDPDSRRLIKATEQTVLPLVGDGVEAPDGVALMGNFHVTNVSEDESWVTVGEWMPRGSALGDLLVAKIKWAKPNRLVER